MKTMKKQIVAIVGRPNVGKSTLFNRIIRRREAITDDMPGVTRDRNYADAEWCGVYFTLIDTGGYLPEEEDAIQKGVLTQVYGAIQEADAIVFVVDAHAGITSIDFEIAQILIKTEKPILLTVNKADSDGGDLASGEFYQLGLGDPVTVSAISGRNTGDFLDDLVAILPYNEANVSEDEPEDESILKLAVVGRPNVGKSSFVNAILGVDKQIVTDIPGTTRDSIDTRFKYHGRELMLIDTAGIRRRSRVNEAVEYYSTIRSFDSIRRCDVALVLIDGSEGLTDQDKKIIEEVIKQKKGLLLAVNKWDLIEKDSKTAQHYEKQLIEGLRGEKFIPIIFISALMKQRLYRTIDIVISIYQERTKRIPTSELNEFLRDVVAAYAPADFGKHQVKLNYCTQVKSAPPVFLFFSNFPKEIKDNYKKYLENKLREQFGFLGVPITFVFRRK